MPHGKNMNEEMPSMATETNAAEVDHAAMMGAQEDMAVIQIPHAALEAVSQVIQFLAPLIDQAAKKSRSDIEAQKGMMTGAPGTLAPEAEQENFNNEMANELNRMRR